MVVGAGGSGLAASARCAELGLSVVVLEKQPQPGGTTGIAIGSFTACRTRFQQRSGIDDSAQAHAEDAAKFADPVIESRNHDGLRSFFLSNAAETLDWLVGMGLAFHGPSPEPPNRVARMHNVVPNAKAYIAALQARTLRGGGKLLCNASVRQLIRDGDRVSGVIAQVAGEQRTFVARRGVVLAAGDYASSTEMIGEFKGEQYAVVDGINPNAQGDGHRLARQAGARLINMDVTYGPELRFVAAGRTDLGTAQTGFSQLLPASGLLAKMAGLLLPLVPKRLVAAWIKRLLVTWQHPEDELFEKGAILINQEGKRFCDECRRPDRELALANQTGKVAFILLDQRLIELFGQWPHFISTAPEIAYAYVDDYLKLSPDISITATNLNGLAVARNLPARCVAETVAAVNKQRGQSDLPPLAGEKWVLLGPVKAYFTTTEGGTALSRQFEVLDTNDRPIPGLYAVGQNGLGGQILWGHGLHIAWAMTSGRMVAEHLARL